MAEDARDTVPHRRRREQRTDYQQRLEQLKSGEVRAVVRLSNSNAAVQFIAYRPDGDETVAAATSRHLAEHGWDQHTGNTPAAYLTGYLAGKRALDAGVETAVPDLGLKKPEDRGRRYAVLQGLADAGLDIDVDEAVTPDEDRMQGAHIDEYEEDGVTDMFADARDSIDDSYGDA